MFKTALTQRIHETQLFRIKRNCSVFILPQPYPLPLQAAQLQIAPFPYQFLFAPKPPVIPQPPNVYFVQEHPIPGSYLKNFNISSKLSIDGLQWRFNPQEAKTQCGFWEVLVVGFKSVL